MDEMIRFVMLAQNGRFAVSNLCVQFGISRKTGYEHLDRYAADGLKGLAVRSHRPHQFPQRTDAAVEALIVAERQLQLNVSRRPQTATLPRPLPAPT